MNQAFNLVECLSKLNTLSPMVYDIHKLGNPEVSGNVAKRYQ